MTASFGPWPCLTCPVKAPGFCRAFGADEASASRLRSDNIRQTHATALAGRVIFRPGKSAEDVYVLCEGWAYTHARLADGRRQIFRFLLPGDIFSNRMVLGQEDYLTVVSATEIRYSRINAGDLQSVVARSPDLLKRAVRFCGEDEQQDLETLIDLGQRNAEERIAHFIIRLSKRLTMIGIASESSRYPFPIRQSEIADAVGLTPVHVSRVMTKFRREDLIDVRWGELVIKDRPELDRRALLG